MTWQLLHLTLKIDSNIHFTHKNVIFKHESTKQNNSLRYMYIFTQPGIQNLWNLYFFFFLKKRFISRFVSYMIHKFMESQQFGKLHSKESQTFSYMEVLMCSCLLRYYYCIHVT